MKKTKDIISIKDFSKEELLEILFLANRLEQMKREEKYKLMQGKVLATLFFEPSTRTRLSFDSAMQHLGGRVIGFADPGATSGKKGESLRDTIRTVERYCDIIAMRHPIEGSARLASEFSQVPILNGGDGANQHPTQTCLDLYTIQKKKGTLDNLTVGFLGDLKYGRTVHSLVAALSHFNVEMIFIADESLKIPRYLIDLLHKKGLKFLETGDLLGTIPKLDVLYATRIQKERFPDPIDYERVRGKYKIKKSMFENAKKDMIIMHPLPRVDEMNYDLDDTPHAVYFDQLANGIHVRQALICKCLGVLQ